MEIFLKKTGWTGIITSLVFTLIGIVLIVNPEVTIKVISYVLGAIFICVGVVKIVDYFVTKGSSDFYNYDLIYGIIAIILGVITILYSNTIGTVFRIIIGVWIIYSALMRFGFSLKLRKVGATTWIATLLLAICMIIFGIFILFNTNAVMVTVGAIVVAYSIADLIESIIFVRDIDKIF